MALNSGNEVFRAVQVIVLWLIVFIVEVSCKPAVVSCHPSQGLAGSVKSVAILVKRHANLSVNFRHESRLLSSESYTLPNDGKSHSLGNNLQAQFYGREVCVSSTKFTVVNERSASQRRHVSCERVCFGLGSRVKLVTNSSSGGRVWPGQRNICCVWGREIFVEMSVSLLGSQCATCEGSRCLKSKVTTKQCSPGDKCFALTLDSKNSKTTDRSSLPVRSGCTSDPSFRGYTCKDGCRQEVDVIGTGKRKLCVRCCTGDECNKMEQLVMASTKNTTNSIKTTTEKPALKSRDSPEIAQSRAHLGFTSDLRTLLICLTCTILRLFGHS